MVGDVQLPRQKDWPSILPSHHVEPLQLNTEDQGRPLYLVLLGGGHLLQTLLTLVHGLPLPEVLPPKVAPQSSIDVVGLPEQKSISHSGKN